MRFGAWIASATCVLLAACAGEGPDGLGSASSALTLSPVGEWKLEDNALDTSGNGNNGTIVGATFIDGKLRRALHFNGGTDSLNLGGSATMQFDLNEAFSTSLWVNTTPNGADHGLIGTTWSGPGWHVRVNAANRIRFILVQTPTTFRFVDSTVAITSGWHHVASTYDGVSAMRIYLDGVDVTGALQTSGTVTSITSTANVLAGTISGGNAALTGDLDQIRLFGGVLTAADVTELFTESDNQVPVATAGSASTATNTPVTITLNGTDADGDPLTFAIGTGPTNGTLGTISQVSPTSATVQYTPTTGYTGPDSFTFTVNDTRANSTAATVSITVSATTTSGSLLGEWKLEDNALDTSGNGNHGTVTGATFVNGRVGRALAFDSAGDSLALGNSSVLQFDLTNGFSTSTWINTTASGVDQVIIGNTWFGAGWHVRITAANRIRFILVQNATTYRYVDSNVFVAPGWHHVASTWDGITPRIYVDGVDASSAIQTSGMPTTIATSTGLLVGSVPGATAPFSGSIDQIRIYDGAISSSLVTTLYREGSNNSQPVATDTSATTPMDTPVTITLSGSDPDGTSVTFSIASNPSNGTLGAITQLTSTTASVQYTPTASYTGVDSFTFVANDGSLTSNPATGSIIVTPTQSMLVGQWELEDEALDYSEYGNDGTITGATFIDGYVGRALRFDGVDDLVNVGNDGSLQFGLASSFSISLWVNQTTNGANQGLIGNTWSGNGWHVRLLADNRVRLILVQGGNSFHYVDSTIAIASGWHHIATTSDGAGDLHIYIDSVDVSGSEAFAGTLTSITNGGDVLIGGLPGISAPYLGDLDQIRLYNVVLTSGEVTELFEEVD